MAKAKDDLSDLIGTKKSSKKDTKPEKKSAAKKPEAKKASKKNGKATRTVTAKGEGDHYFPKGEGTERAKLAAGILKRLKKPISVRDFAKAHEIDGWKVRFSANDLRDAGKIKFKKEKGQSVVMVPK